MNRVYLCIDLKTFFASVECVERNLNPFTTNLIVADDTRGQGTICLAISPKMKMLGVKNRCRVFEIPKNIKYIVAKPRMSKYIEYAANVYSIYLKYISKEDIHVYSIDEAFLDVTEYLKTYKMNAIELAQTIMKDIYKTYGLTATAGIGTNLYLAKIALDIMSKHSSTNIGWLNEEKYLRELSHHRPLSDFWQIGKAIEKRLNKLRIYDMYDIAHANKERLYKEFGINAELLIDHAQGKESCTIKDIKEYIPKSTSISTSQILFEDYNFEDAKLVVKEMVEQKCLELIDSNLYTSCIKLYVGYSKDIIKAVSKSHKLVTPSNTYIEIVEEFLKLYDKNVNRHFPIRRLGVCMSSLSGPTYEQLSFFVDHEAQEKQRNLAKVVSHLKTEYGKNSILKGVNLEEKSTAILRNSLIGGHNAK